MVVAIAEVHTCIYIIRDSSFYEEDVTVFAFAGKITFTWQEVKWLISHVYAHIFF